HSGLPEGTGSGSGEDVVQVASGTLSVDGRRAAGPGPGLQSAANAVGDRNSGTITAVFDAGEIWRGPGPGAPGDSARFQQSDRARAAGKGEYRAETAAKPAEGAAVRGKRPSFAGRRETTGSQGGRGQRFATGFQLWSRRRPETRHTKRAGEFAASGG